MFCTDGSFLRERNKLNLAKPKHEFAQCFGIYHDCKHQRALRDGENIHHGMELPPDVSCQATLSHLKREHVWFMFELYQIRVARTIRVEGIFSRPFSEQKTIKGVSNQVKNQMKCKCFRSLKSLINQFYQWSNHSLFPFQIVVKYKLVTSNKLQGNNLL